MTGFFDATAQDVRYAVRSLRRTPLFVVTAVLSLAIGLGANAAIFSLASALLLRPLAGLDAPRRLVDIGRTINGQGFDTSSYPNYRDIRDRTRTLSGVYAWRIEPEAMSLAGPNEADRVYGSLVSGNYFSVLGTRAERGRLFLDADDVPGRNEVVVLSDTLWRTRFAADPAIVGTSIVLTGRRYTVVGVAPRGFQGTTLLKGDLWLPLTTQVLGKSSNMLTSRRSSWLILGGRLAPGVTVGQADAELRTIGQSLTREYPRENVGRGLTVETASIFPGRTGAIAGFLGVLMAVVGVVLTIACVNLAGMLLARGAARQREIAVRLAIGAGRARIVRQLLTETLLLFTAGCAAGLLLGRWFIGVLLALIPQLPVPVGVDIAVDWRVVSFAVAVALPAAIVSGLAPALQASRADLVPSLKADAAEGRVSRGRLRYAFLVAQVALSLLLIVAGGLFVRALQHAGELQPGFDQDNVDVITIDLSLGGYRQADGLVFLHDLEARARTLPGVRSVTTAADLPLDGGRMSFGDVRAADAPPGEAQAPAPADWNLVTPGFFSTLHVALLRGRDFTNDDTAASPSVVIVNHALAHHFWGDADPIGRDVEIDTGTPTAHRATVVGLAADAQFVALGSTTMYLYAPLTQQYRAAVSLLLKTSGTSAIPAVRNVVKTMNPQLPVVGAMPLGDVTAIGLVPQRIAGAVAGVLGLVGLLLAAMGIHAAAASAVNRRAREIGIRLALGASARSIVRLVLGQSMGATLIGVAVGLGLAAVATRFLESLLLGVRAMDALTYGGAAAIFLVCAAAVSFLPARRATRVDPSRALRVS